ncbi:MAG TPA: VPLPA-CTERM sorting domain-containing protein [Thiotrichales bacterium]|nr:VPLPA-CTERM sorting domain-containing protein [Thiotrichales bacterium]
MKLISQLATTAFISLIATTAQAAQVKVTITNNAPAGGVALTPVWVGFHNGSFDLFNSGEAASSELESLAEDGNASGISSVFGANGTLAASGTAAAGNRVQGMVGGAPITAGSTVSAMFNLSGNLDNQYFSYASMVLPSSDYFIANGDPFEYDLGDLFANGGSISFNIGVFGDVNDAGTEVNDFTTSAGNGLFPGLPPMQGAANTGADENGVVHDVLDPYANFLNTPNGFDLTNFDFSSYNLYPHGIATVTISAVPVPAAAWLMGSGLIGLVGVARRHNKVL